MPNTTDLAARFIAKLWSAQPHYTGLYGVLATKDWDTGDWANHPIDAWSKNPPNTAGVENAPDLYFTPCLFDKPLARKEHAQPSRVLYADLDEVDPNTLIDIPPSLAWETSPEHFQAVWLLDRPLVTKTFERLNQRLTYATGADRGGWSATKVLRVPGSLSTKYAKPFRIKLVHLKNRRRYTVEEMRKLLRDIPTTLDAPGTLPPSNILPNPNDTYKNLRSKIPVRARQLLKTKTLVSSDDRSARLWELESLLIGAGLEPEEVYVLVKRCVWNKYAGQRREATQLWNEIAKCAANVSEPKEDEPKKKPSVARLKGRWVSNFRNELHPIPNWLVREMWVQGAFGFLAGESKTYKSLLALDMAISVSSGTPFLGYFPVGKPRTVMLFQEENDPGLVQDRLKRIEFARDGLGPSSQGYVLTGLRGAKYPLRLYNRQDIDLHKDSDLKALHREIRKYRPSLVVLDPLYMMIPTLDESEAAAITPMLRNLMTLQGDTDTSIQIVHHNRKPQQHSTKSRLMHLMSGTGAFGRRFDSAIFVEVMEEDKNKPVLRISSQHRAQISGNTYTVSFAMPDDDAMSYTASVSEWTEQDDIDNEASRTQMVLDEAVGKTKPNTPELTEVTAVRILAKRLGLRPQAVQRMYEKDPRYTVSKHRDGYLYIHPKEQG